MNDTKTLKKGQMWSYKSCNDTKSYIKLIRLDNDDVIHIAIKNINILGEIVNIDHMPFVKSVVSDSLIDFLGMDNDESELELVEEWEKLNGGVYKISIQEAIGLVEDTLS